MLDFRSNLWSQYFVLSSALPGDFAFCLGLWQEIISGHPGIIGGTASMQSYDISTVVPRCKNADVVQVYPNLLQMQIVWNMLEYTGDLHGKYS